MKGIPCPNKVDLQDNENSRFPQMLQVCFRISGYSSYRIGLSRNLCERIHWSLSYKSCSMGKSCTSRESYRNKESRVYIDSILGSGDSKSVPQEDKDCRYRLVGLSRT